MPLNAAGMLFLANTLQTDALLFAQLHSGLAGDGTDNIAVPGRQPVDWDTPVGNGDFGLISAIDFTGGTPGGDVYSVTIWDAETDGSCHGEFPITDGDITFNLMGQFSITAIDATGASS